MNDTTHSVTLPNGQILTDQMSPVERYNAVAKSIGVPSAERPPPPVFGPQGLTPATANEFARRDAQAAKAPPPSAPARVVVPPQGTPEERARDTSGRFTPVAPASSALKVDTAAIAKLNEVWRAMTPEQREAKRATYERDLASIFEGRKLGESVAQFQARTAGAPAQVPSEPAASTFTPKQWEEGHKSVTDKEGWIPLDRVNPAGLSGYVLPRVVEGQQFRSSVFAQLADARAAGISQGAVDSFIRAQMTRDGFIK